MKNINPILVTSPKCILHDWTAFVISMGIFMEEIWKDIPGYEGLYQASNYGDIKSLERTKLFNLNNPLLKRRVRERILKPMIDPDGYYHNTLFKNGIAHNYQTHTIIWIVFFGIEYDKIKYKIDHIDDIKINNRTDNLQILTSGENIGKGYQAKGKILPCGITLKNRRFVARFQVNKKSYYIGSYLSLKEAESEYQKFLSKI